MIYQSNIYVDITDFLSIIQLYLTIYIYNVGIIKKLYVIIIYSFIMQVNTKLV